jgi:hypothetical protein
MYKNRPRLYLFHSYQIHVSRSCIIYSHYWPRGESPGCHKLQKRIANAVDKTDFLKDRYIKREYKTTAYSGRVVSKTEMDRELTQYLLLSRLWLLENFDNI